jgi:hypothetical protein
MKREGSVDELAEALEVSKSFHAHLHKWQRPRRRGDQRLRALVRSSSKKVVPPMVARAFDLICANGASAAERTASPGSCARRVCVLNRSAVSGPVRMIVLTNTRLRKTGLPRCRRQIDLAASGRAISPTSKPLRDGFTWPSPLTAVRVGSSLITVATLLVELTTTTFDLAATRQRPLAGLIHHSETVVASMPPRLSSGA